MGDLRSIPWLLSPADRFVILFSPTFGRCRDASPQIFGDFADSSAGVALDKPKNISKFSWLFDFLGATPDTMSSPALVMKRQRLRGLAPQLWTPLHADVGREWLTST
jgi:hypothetical protein